MEILIKEEYDISKDRISGKIRRGSIFIHPTDTIYGLGCSAIDSLAVTRLRELKGRVSKPFSVIAPSKDWIYENCAITENADRWIRQLPAPLTLILRTKNSEVAPEVAPGIKTIGVRIPAHWISDMVADLGFPIVTTSANIVSGDFMTSLDDLESELKPGIDFVLYEGEKKGRPSKIIDLSEESLQVIER